MSMKLLITLLRNFSAVFVAKGIRLQIRFYHRGIQLVNIIFFYKKLLFGSNSESDCEIRDIKTISESEVEMIVSALILKG